VGLALLLNERRTDAIEEIAAGVAMLEQLPAKSPTSTWYLWPLLAAVERRDARHALALTDTSDLRIARGFDALWLLAAAVEAGRRDDLTEAAALLERSLAQFDRCPGFTGYRHLGLRLAAEAALEDGWGDPQQWLVEADAWFRDRDLQRPAQACRSLAAAAGVPARRRRGEEPPSALAAMGVTSREIDVLGLLGEGLTNRGIGERLYISPSTVKTHVEHLLTKTGTSNRAQLAALAVTHLGVDGPAST
jgi:DNA-binding CsgD family transcriptional regulator